jgi:hypothetical protein
MLVVLLFSKIVWLWSRINNVFISSNGFYSKAKEKIKKEHSLGHVFERTQCASQQPVHQSHLVGHNFCVVVVIVCVVTVTATVTWSSFFFGYRSPIIILNYHK